MRNKRRETSNCVVQLKYRICFTLFSAKLFPFTSIFFLYLHTLLCYTQICSLFPPSLAQRQKVSLIWSSCIQTVITSHSLLVTANVTAAVQLETPPLVWIKMNENTSLRSTSLDSICHRLDHRRE